MPKPRATIDPSDVRHPSAALDQALQGQRQSPSREQLAFTNTRYWELKGTLDRLASRDDGWLRIVPHPAEDRIYLKWKFTAGKWERHYVMAVVTMYQMPEGLMLLAHKVQEAEQGLLKPTLDKLVGEDS